MPTDARVASIPVLRIWSISRRAHRRAMRNRQRHSIYAAGLRYARSTRQRDGAGKDAPLTKLEPPRGQPPQASPDESRADGPRGPTASTCSVVSTRPSENRRTVRVMRRPFWMMVCWDVLTPAGPEEVKLMLLEHAAPKPENKPPRSLSPLALHKTR